MNESALRVPIRLPDLGIDDARLTLSVWLVPLGATVTAGDRVVEILAGEAVVAAVAGYRVRLAVADTAEIAAADRRAAGDAAEDDEVHDDLHGILVLPSSCRVVCLLHRLQPNSNRLIEELGH